jgi:hypothetical protein
MAIILKTEKVWEDGKQCRKITNFKALNFEDVPEQYHEAGTGPACFISKITNELIIWEKVLTNKQIILYKDITIPEERFQFILKLIRKAGDRLMKINKKLEQEKRKAWSGKETFKI